MIKKIGHVTILVKNQDDAAKFYTEKLGFIKREDTFFGKDMRWVTVSPKKQKNLELTFVNADSKKKLVALGKQAGDHVLLTIETDNCMKDYEEMKQKGVKFYGKPEQRPYGTEVVFEDLYGNLFDLIQRPKTASP
jgi:catechol 2,3-dioxygenase-like lactoylglutathione lyase family enzyme